MGTYVEFNVKCCVKGEPKKVGERGLIDDNEFKTLSRMKRMGVPYVTELPFDYGEGVERNLEEEAKLDEEDKDDSEGSDSKELTQEQMDKVAEDTRQAKETDEDGRPKSKASTATTKKKETSKK